MTERPILFSAPMVRALLDGTKTQTRRVVKPQPFDRSYSKHDHRMAYASGRASAGDEIDGFYAYSTSSGGEWQVKCPYGQPGDRLWVRETCWIADGATDLGGVVHCADREGLTMGGMKKRPSIHMPRWASRILLEITGVRVERLHAITHQDAMAEGVWTASHATKDDILIGTGGQRLSHIGAYANLWDDINGPGTWSTNPWVWVIEFRRIE